MGHYTHTLECNVPVEYAFKYITDYRLIPEWVMGVNRCNPLTDQTEGVGAEFDGVVNLGPISVHLLMAFIKWDENREFATRFTKGVEGTLTMNFEAIDENRARMSAELNYSAGNGLMGRLLDKAIRAFIPMCLRYVDKTLSRKLHDGYAEMTTA